MDRIGSLSPNTLAYIGDAVFHLEVRSRLVAAHGDMSSKALSVKAAGTVAAAAQAKILDRIEPRLNDFELDLARRARNLYNKAVPKNATLAEYKKATGLEAVLGYYYLVKNERLGEILKLIFEE